MRVGPSASHRERYRLGLSRKDLMVCIDQVDLNLVRTRRHPGQVDRIEIARVRPQPGQVVHLYVQMPNPWRYVEGGLPEYR